MQEELKPDVVLLSDEEIPFLRLFLEDKFSIQEYPSHEFSIELLADECPGLLLLVFPLGKLDGLEWIRQIRERSLCPMMLLGVEVPFSFYLQGLDAGADDFLCQDLKECFENTEARMSLLTELSTRMVALARRLGRSGGMLEDGQEIVCGPLVIHLDEMQVTMGGQPVELTPTEFKLLLRFVRSPGELLSHEELLCDLWGEQFVDERQYLRVYVSKIREKLSLVDGEPLHIETVPKKGYRLNVFTAEELDKENTCQL